MTSDTTIPASRSPQRLHGARTVLKEAPVGHMAGGRPVVYPDDYEDDIYDNGVEPEPEDDKD